MIDKNINISKYLEIIGNTSLFKNIDKNLIPQILDKLDIKIKKYNKNEIIFMQGDIANNFFILLDGEIIISRNSDVGYESIIAHINKSGDMFAEVFAFMENKSYDNYCYSSTDNTFVLSISSNKFLNNFFDTYTDNVLQKNILDILSQKAYYLNQRVYVLSGINLRQKIARAISINTLSNKIKSSRTLLANYIASTRPSVSRELLKMEDEGIISFTENGIIQFDLEQIQEYL